jgi:ketosteroid isomerase-like protein
MWGAADNFATSLNDQVDAYLTAFNQMDLTKVLTYFADDAVYQPGDGSIFYGMEELRQAFTPQFARAYGTMVFEEEDRIIDYEHRKVMLSWTCKIDISKAKFVSLSSWSRVAIGRLRFGTRGHWKGLDLLYFGLDGRINRKLTYANYTSLKIIRGWDRPAAAPRRD